MGMIAMATNELAKRGFYIDGGWPLNVWVCLVGGSSSGKSTSLSMVQRFAADLRAASAAPDDEDWIQAEGSMSGLLAALAGRFDKVRGTTTALFYHQEFATLFSAREPISEMMCQIVDGTNYERHLREIQRRADRKERERIVSPVVSAIFCTTEDQLAEQFKAAHRTGGLYSRIVWVRGEIALDNLRLPEAYVHGIMPPAYWAVQDEWKAWLAVLEFAGADQGRAIKFTPEALELFKMAVFEPLKVKMTEGDVWNAVRLRFVDKTRVLATVLAAGRGSLLVHPEDVQRAIRLSDLLLEHATSLSTVGTDPIFRLAGRAERFVLAQGDEGATRRELYRALRVGKRELNEALETLIDREAVIEDRKGLDGRVRLFHVDSEYAKKIRTRQMS
jgi:hypothetical protein